MLTDLILGKYSILILGYQPDYIYVRNFLCVGIPYFTIGIYLRMYWEKILSIKYVTMFAMVLSFFFCLTTLLEKRGLEFLEKNATRDHYLSSTLLAISLFITFVSVHRQTPNCLTKIGEKDSLYIYILHPLFIIFFSKLNAMMSEQWNMIYNVIAPFIILGSTLTFVYILRKTTILK